MEPCRHAFIIRAAQYGMKTPLMVVCPACGTGGELHTPANKYAAMAEDAENIVRVLAPRARMEAMPREAERLLLEAARRLRQLAGEPVPEVGQ